MSVTINGTTGIETPAVETADSLQIGNDATSSNNFTIYQPSTPDGTLRIGQGNADSPTEVGQFNANGYKPAEPVTFRAYRGSSQSVSANTWTKIAFDTEAWDTNSNYDNSTNYRFTPTVAGYYQFNTSLFYSGTFSRKVIAFRKNGSEYSTVFDNNVSSDQNRYGGSVLAYMNGTDYMEVYTYIAGTTVLGGAATTWFDGILIAQA